MISLFVQQICLIGVKEELDKRETHLVPLGIPIIFFTIFPSEFYKYIIDTELQYTDDFTFCVALFAFCFALDNAYD